MLNDGTSIRGAIGFAGVPGTDSAGVAGGVTPMPAAAGATPMMEQYIEIKSANPDSLLFYRMGDFYEMFFDDAEVASRALGIALTKRGKHQGLDIPMCGVPVHAADDYLQKLIGLGHRIAVCEQMEDPAEAKKRGSKSVVRRDVIRLVTPGTITEEKLLAPSETNYLMALGRVKGDSTALALAWIDISTGAFRVTESVPDRLLSDILRIDPRELIVAETVFHDEAMRPVFDMLGRIVSPQPPILFDSGGAADRIGRFFGIATLDGLGQFSRAELSAISGVIAYVEKTQKAERPPLTRPEHEQAGASLFIDAATRANLELTRTLSGERDGSLLKAIDRTVTGTGARLLAERLMSPLTDPAAIGARLDSVSFLLGEPGLTEALRAALKRAPDMQRALSRLALNRGGPRDLGSLASGLAAAREIAGLIGGAELPAELRAAGVALGDLPVDFAEHLETALADDLPLLKRDGGLVRAGYDGELDEMRALRDQSRRVIAGMERDLADETGIRSLKIRHNNVLGYYIEVTANHREIMTGSDAVRARFIHRQTMASAMRFTTTELADLETKIANAADRALQIELAAFDRLVGEAVGHAAAIRAGAQALALFDVSAALATLAEAENYCRPQVDGQSRLRDRGRPPSGGRTGACAARRQIPSSPMIATCRPPMATTKGAIWLLTGPNMGGKSTFLRQNALIAILAQTGSFVPAQSAAIGVVDRLFSRVGASDDLARGRSTFMVEMVETAAILNQAGERALVILDEIGRGTATFDGLSIAWAAVEHLHEKNRCRAIFATHFHEMTALAGKLPRLDNVTMRVKEWEGDVVFLHEVGAGRGRPLLRHPGGPAGRPARRRGGAGAARCCSQLEAGETSGKARSARRRPAAVFRRRAEGAATAGQI